MNEVKYVPLETIDTALAHLNNCMRTPSTLCQLQKHVADLKNEDSELSKTLQSIYDYFTSISAYKFYQKDKLNLNLILALMQGLLPIGITRSIDRSLIDRATGNISNLSTELVDLQTWGLGLNSYIRINTHKIITLYHYAMVLAMNRDVSSTYEKVLLTIDTGSPENAVIKPPFIPSAEFYYPRDFNTNARYLFNHIMLEASTPFALMSMTINYDKIIELTKLALALKKAPALHEAGQYSGRDLAQPIEVITRQAANTIELQIHRGLTMYGSMNRLVNNVSVVALPVTYYVWFSLQKNIQQNEFRVVYNFLNSEVVFTAPPNIGTKHKNYTSQIMAYVILLESIRDFLNEHDMVIHTLNDLQVLRAIKTEFSNPNDNTILTEPLLAPFLATNLSEDIKLQIITCFASFCNQHGVDPNRIMQQLRNIYISIFNQKRAKPPIYGPITLTTYILNLDSYHNLVAFLARTINYAYIQMCYLIYHSIITIIYQPLFVATNYRSVFGDFVIEFKQGLNSAYNPKWIIGSASSIIKYSVPIGIIYAPHVEHLQEAYTLRVVDETGVRVCNNQFWPNSVLARPGRDIEARTAYQAYDRQNILFTIDYHTNTTSSVTKGLKLIKMYVDTIVNHYYHAAFATHMVHSMLNTGTGQNVQNSSVHLIHDAVIHDVEGLKEISGLLSLISGMLHWLIVRPFIQYLGYLIESNAIPFRVGQTIRFAILGGYFARASIFVTIFTIAEKLFPQYNRAIGPILFHLYSFVYFFVIYGKYYRISENLIPSTLARDGAAPGAITTSITYTKQNLNAAIRQYNRTLSFNQFLLKCFDVINIPTPLAMILNLIIYNNDSLKNVLSTPGTFISLAFTTATLTGSTVVGTFLMTKDAFKMTMLIIMSWFGFKLLDYTLGAIMENIFKADTKTNKIASDIVSSLFNFFSKFLQEFSSIMLYPVSGYINTDIVKIFFRRFNPVRMYLEILRFFVQIIGDILAPLYQASTGSLRMLIIKPLTLVKDRILLDFKNSPLMIIYWYFTSTPYLLNKMTINRFFFSFRRYSMWNLIYKLLKLPFRILQELYFNVIDANGIQQRILTDRANTPIKLQDNTIRQIHSNKTNFVLIDSPKRRSVAIIKPDDIRLIATYSSYVTKYDGFSAEIVVDFAILLQYPRYFLYEMYQKKKSKTNGQSSKKEAAQFAKSIAIEIVKRPRFLNKQLIFVLYLIDEYLTVVFDAAKTQNEQLLNVKDEIDFAAKQVKKNQARRYTLIKQKSMAQQLYKDITDVIAHPESYFFHLDKHITNCTLIMGHILRQYPYITPFSHDIIQSTSENDLYNKIYIIHASDIYRAIFIGIPMARVAIVAIPHKERTYRPLHYYKLDTRNINLKLGAFPSNSVVADTFLFVDSKQWQAFIQSKQDTDRGFINSNTQALKHVYQMKQQMSFAIFRHVIGTRLMAVLDLLTDMKQLLESFEPTYQLFYTICKDKDVSKIQQGLNKLETHLTDMRQKIYTELNQLVNSNMLITNFLDYAKFSEKLELIIQKLYYNYVEYDVKYCRFNEIQLKTHLYDLVNMYCSEYGLSTIYKWMVWYFGVDTTYTPGLINMLAIRLRINEDWSYGRLDLLHDELFGQIQGLFKDRIGFMPVEGVMNLAQQNVGTRVSGFQEFIDPMVLRIDFSERIYRIMAIHQAVIA